MDASVATMGERKHSVSLLVSGRDVTQLQREAKTELQEGNWNESYHSQLGMPALKAQGRTFQQILAGRGRIRWRDEGVREDTESFHSLCVHICPEFKSFLSFAL